MWFLNLLSRRLGDHIHYILAPSQRHFLYVLECFRRGISTVRKSGSKMPSNSSGALTDYLFTKQRLLVIGFICTDLVSNKSSRLCSIESWLFVVSRSLRVRKSMRCRLSWAARQTFAAREKGRTFARWSRPSPTLHMPSATKAFSSGCSRWSATTTLRWTPLWKTRRVSAFSVGFHVGHRIDRFSDEAFSSDPEPLRLYL